MKAVFLAVLFPFLFLGQAFAQNIRWDSVAATTNGQGTAVPILAMPGASVAFFNACTSQPCSPTRATTYTSSTSVTACPSGAQVVWQLPYNQACTSSADERGEFGAYFQPGAYLYTYTKSGLTYGPFAFNVIGDSSGSGPNFPVPITAPEINNTFYADGFPGACTVSGVNYTTQLDCAWRTALATTATSAANPTVVVSAGVNYTTCAGLPMILPGAMGSSSVNLFSLGVNAGNNLGGGANNGVATIRQTCSITTGTLALPRVSGSASKQLSVLGVSIDANHLAPYAIQIIGQNNASVFRNVQVANGTTAPSVFGIRFDTPNGWTNSADLEDWNVVDNCGVVNGCGGSGAVTVSLSGGVPSFTVTNGGSNYDSNTIATLVGYQNGKSNKPCSSMGTTTPVISGGAITGITSSATGCVGTVYLQLTDNHSVNYGIDFENFTDAQKISGLNIRTGNIAGLFCNGCGNDLFEGVHAWGEGLFGIQAAGTITFVGTNCGETSLACFDNIDGGGGAHVTAIGTQYHSGTEFQGFSVFRNESNQSQFKISELTCQETHANEFHTLANQFGPYDGVGGNLVNNSLVDAEYCGQGTGNTATALQPFAQFLGPVVVSTTTTFALSSISPFVACSASAIAAPPTISGTVVTFPTDGVHNGGSVQCTDSSGRVTLQSIPNSGSPASPQTFDLASQFATSSSTWVRLDAPDADIFLNATHVVMQNGTLQVGSGGTITATTAATATSATTATSAGSVTGTNPVLRCTTAGALPVGALTITAGNCGASTATNLSVN